LAERLVFRWRRTSSKRVSGLVEIQAKSLKLFILLNTNDVPPSADGFMAGMVLVIDEVHLDISEPEQGETISRGHQESAPQRVGSDWRPADSRSAG
jgi:hypothetical protein